MMSNSYELTCVLGRGARRFDRDLSSSEHF